MRTVYSTRFGPVLSIPGTAYAWTRKTAYAVADADNGNLRAGDGWLDSPGRTRCAIFANRSRGILGAPFINTMAADRSGEALYADISAAPNLSAQRFAACGTVSDRIPGQLQRFYVLDGSRSTCNWENGSGTPARGLLPAAKMVTLYRRDYRAEQQRQLPLDQSRRPPRRNGSHHGKGSRRTAGPAHAFGPARNQSGTKVRKVRYRSGRADNVEQ